MLKGRERIKKAVCCLEAERLLAQKKNCLDELQRGVELQIKIYRRCGEGRRGEKKLLRMCANVYRLYIFFDAVIMVYVDNGNCVAVVTLHCTHTFVATVTICYRDNCIGFVMIAFCCHDNRVRCSCNALLTLRICCHGN